VCVFERERERGIASRNRLHYFRVIISRSAHILQLFLESFLCLGCTPPPHPNKNTEPAAKLGASL